MPVKECDPSSLLNVKPGSCNPSSSQSRKVFETISSLLDNLKYCRAKQDFHQSLVPLKVRRRADVSRPRNSTSSSGSSTGSSKDDHRLGRGRHRRSSGEFEHYSRLLPNSGNLFPKVASSNFEQARFSHSTDDSDEGTLELQPFIDELGCTTSDRRRHAADKVRRLAKSSTRISMTLVKMGAIGPLISMLDTTNEKAVQNAALLALLNLAIGTNVNKAAIVTAGAVPKMVNLAQESVDAETVQESLAAVFLSLSALDVNKPVIGNSGAVPALINILKQGTFKAKKDALKALYNLSIFHGNIKVIVEANIIQSLLDMIYHPELVETAVDLLGNLAATETGRRAIIDKQDAVLILVDVLGWADAPECQEKAVSVLMTMARRSRALRQAIARSGAVTALLELSMLGSSIAQKVAAWILDCLKQDEDFSRSSKSSGFHDFVHCEETQPGKFVHKVLQQRTMNPQRITSHDTSDHFISITL